MSEAAIIGPTSIRRRSRMWWIDVAPLFLLPAAAFILLPPEWPRWALMWALALAIYAGFKWLSWRQVPVRSAPAWKHLAYLFAWPGMNAAEFLNPQAASVPAPPSGREWGRSILKVAIGLGLLFGLARLFAEQHLYLAGWVGMIGMALTLHFGAFHLLSCWWRSVGIPARPLMDRPLASASLGEFWGRRWNSAFRDLAHRFLFRPMTPWLGPRGAVFAGFAISGAIHDL